MALRVLLLISVTATVALAACGGETRTVTETATVTETQAGVEPAASEADTGSSSSPTDFCDSEDGDALAQADSSAGDAFNDADVAAMLRQEKRILRIAKRAPEGAECAVTALKTLRFNWNHGSGNFAGVDTEAKARAIRRFQKEHDLLQADYG